MRRTRDLAIFMTMTTDRQTKPITLPLAHARGVKITVLMYVCMDVCMYVHVCMYVCEVYVVIRYPRACAQLRYSKDMVDVDCMLTLNLAH